MSAPGARLRVAMMRFALLALIGPWSAPLWALPSDRALNEYTLTHWNSSDGLAHNMVTTMAQTGDGYLWLGSFEGLSRFNGHEFRVYDDQTLPFTGVNGIRGLVVDGGRLWVSTSRSGLFALDSSGWQGYGPEQGQPFEQMLGAELGGDGWLWLIGEENGIARWRPGREALHINHASGLAHDTVYVTLGDGAGGVFVGTAAGLDHVNADAVVEHWGAQRGLPPGPVRSVQRAPDGSLAVTVGGKVGWISDRGYRPLSGAQVPGSAQVLLYDNDGGLLIGTADQGLWRHSPRGLEQLDRRHGLHGNRVVSLFEGREGDIWIGSADGLYQLRDLRFSTIDERHGIGEGYVRALWEQPAGTLWIGSTDGLYRRDGDNVQRFGREQGLPNESILALAYSKSLGLLVGTFGGGLVRIADDRAQPVPGTEALASLQVRALLPHSDGSLWIASNSGLFHLRGQRLTRYGRDNGLPRDFTMALSEGADGEIWIGSSGGLVRFDGQQFQSYGPQQGLQAEDVFSVLVEASGELWIGSNRGLKHYAQGRFLDVPGDDPAFNTSLFQILKDRRGDVWISSNRGIFLVSGSELAAVRAGRSGPVHVRRHDRSDGMSSEQANGASQPAGIAMADGSLRFATAVGVVVVTPERRFPQRPVRLDPVIESIHVDGEDMAITEGQRLPAGTRRVEFRYVGLSLLAPERVSYRHRLLGFDEHWVDVGNQRLASYTNLAPGSYRFEVEAATAESAAQRTALEFSIEPLWWQRASTLALGGVLGLSLMTLAWRRRTTQLRHRSAELERLVNERTRDLQVTARELAQADQDKNLLVEKLREQAEAFERQAREDWLTGLPNRRAFEELLQQQIQRAGASASPLCVALADIDHFKDINDRHSHATGDRVLIAVAEALREGAGAGALIARWGGEEFMLLFPDCSREQALQRCEQLRAAIAARVPFFGDGAPPQVTLSFGVAEFSDAAGGRERLLSQADRRLYQAKDAGRNCVR